MGYPTSGSKIDSNTICNDLEKSYKYCLFFAQAVLTDLKWVYYIERSPYLYSVKKFLPYPMWDVTVIVFYFHEDSNLFPSLCPVQPFYK